MKSPSVLRENRQRSKMQASPLMFESDDEDSDAVDSANSSNKENAEESIAEPNKEERILKGFQTVLMGIPPPPAFTVPQLDCREILKLWRENQAFKITLSAEKCKNNKDLSKKVEEKAKTTKWPETLQLDYWDVYYNKSSASEELERLSVRYKERYVGAETSSCINALFAKSPMRTASARKRARHRAWGHSPGRRLSHLARRRKAFSSASLCSVAGNNNPDKKMIMVEIKKIGNRQKKKGSVKKTKPTPKKKSKPQANTFKRALFQSPDQDPSNAASKTPSTQCIQRSKRNLFSNSSEKKNEFGKRERPMPTRVSPRKRVNRSLSFQESSQPSTPSLNVPILAPPTTQPAQVLTGAHKQKMLWAATNALREEGMGMSHELFRPCMTVLFRTCQRLWVTRAGIGRPDTEGSTSERMLALAKQFSTYTIREISSDPTSEHMTLVYNNSLKMAENVLSQLCTSEVNCETSVCSVKNTKSNSGKQKNSKTDDRKTLFGSSCKADRNLTNKLTDSVDLPVVKKLENITENKRTTTKNEPGQGSNLEVRNVVVNLIKNTPCKSSFNDRDSPRSSPRLERKSDCTVKVNRSIRNALFSTEANQKICEKVDKEISNSLCNNNQYKECNMASDESKKHTSPQSENTELGCLSKESNLSKKQTLLKSRALMTRSLCEMDGSNVAVVSNSSPKSDCNTDSSNGQNEETTNVVQVCNPSVDDSIQQGIISVCVENNASCLETTEYNPQNKHTPSKLSFNIVQATKNCFVDIRKFSSDVKAKSLFSSPGNGSNKNESSYPPSSTNSILKKTVSDTIFHLTESFGGRRITRSVSTDTKVKNNVQIHHLFSPPTTKINKLSSVKKTNKEVSIQLCSNGQLNTSGAQETPQKTNKGKGLQNKRLRIMRKKSDHKTKNSQNSESSNNKTFGEDVDTKLSNLESDSEKLKDSIHSEDRSTPTKRSLRSTRSPKKKTATRRTSWDAKSTGSVKSIASSCSSQNSDKIVKTVENNEALGSSPEFVSPRTRLKKAQLEKKSKPSHSKDTPDKSANSPEFVSPEIRLGKATLNKRSSVISSDASPSKDTPDETVFSEEYSADNENSHGTFICTSETSLSQRSKNSVENGDYETNKENLGEDRSLGMCNDKNIENGRSPNQRHLLSVENTPRHQVTAEEPVSRMLQLYRLSSSGGDNVETAKLLPEIICLEPPRLVPHWVADEYESEDTLGLKKSPPPLAPHWEQESCSGTSTSLPESIMAHWQQLSATANEDSSDKVMFDFEDTSYEITFPSAMEDSRASSTCAPFDFPHFIDDSKSGFNNVFRRSSTETTD